MKLVVFEKIEKCQKVSNKFTMSYPGKQSKKNVSSKNFYIGAQLSEITQVTEADHLY